MDHSLQCWSEVFLSFTFVFVIIVSFSYVYILKGIVEIHSRLGWMNNDHIIANCLQSVPVKEF